MRRIVRKERPFPIATSSDLLFILDERLGIQRQYTAVQDSFGSVKQCHDR